MAGLIGILGTFSSVNLGQMSGGQKSALRIIRPDPDQHPSSNSIMYKHYTFYSVTDQNSFGGDIFNWIPLTWHPGMKTVL